jgi:hypothetical protein
MTRFESGVWRYSEHACNADDFSAVEDSAFAKAFDRGSAEPLYIDYLRGAEYIFNVVRGHRGPAERDTRVFGIRVDKLVIAECDTFEHYSQLKAVV